MFTFCVRHVASKMFVFFACIPFSLCGQLIETHYGSLEVTEPVLLELLEHPAMQRLKKIHQYGVCYYVINDYDYDRFEHSVGVFALLRMFEAPLDEQIAGLLHDVSHTVFSHVGDFLFKAQGDDSYQDSIHGWYLEESGLADVLKKHGYTADDVIHKNKKFTMLEQNHPHICADRLEYILRGAVLEKKITDSEVYDILAHLRFKDGTWYFIDHQQAALFARAALYLTETLFASFENRATYTFAAEMLQYALEKGYLSKNDIHFGYDDEVWSCVMNQDDAYMKYYVDRILNFRSYYAVSPHETEGSVTIKAKFRGIDPWVLYKGMLKRLTEIDPVFAAEFICSKEWHEQNHFFTFHD